MNEAGMRMSQEDIVFISRLFSDYVQNTKEGKRTTLKLLNATVKPADMRHAYFPFSQNQTPNVRLESKDLMYYAGWIYKEGLALSLDQVEVEKNGNLEGCDATGILGPKDYCVQVVKEYAGRNGERLSSMSNYARLHHQEQHIRDTAKYETCVKCPVISCDYHPQREQRQMKLVEQIPARS